MQVDHSRLNTFIVATMLVVSILAMSQASAITRCGTLEMVTMPGRVLQVAPFADGTVSAIGSSSQDPRIPVLRYFDGHTWTQQSLPSELDGFAFGASGTTPDGEAWFTGTRPYSVYQIEVVFVRVTGGIIDRIDTMLSSVGAPIDLSASSSGNVWALTSAGDIFEFDGSSWNTIDVPDVFVDQHLNPKGIYVVSPTDVWLAGYGSVGKNTDKGFIQHWDGSSWSVSSTPFDEDSSAHFFRDIDGSGPADIWVVGEGLAGASIFLHWDGDSWTQPAGTASHPAMERVMTMEIGNAWAVPIQGNSAYYWDGSNWSETEAFAFPDNSVTISMRDAEKSASCDAWVVGDYHDGTAYRPWAVRLIPGYVAPVEDAPVVFASSNNVSRVKVSRKTFYGVAVVTVLNDDMQPVSGATITGSFSGPSSEHLSVSSGPDGKAVFSTATQNRPKGEWCFSISDMTLPGATYDASANASTTACEEMSAGEKKGGRPNRRKK